MYKRLLSTTLIICSLSMLSGCTSMEQKVMEQVQKHTNELSKKPAYKYDEYFEKNNVYVHMERLSKKQLSEHYRRTANNFYDIYFVAFTNKSNKDVILSVPATSVTKKNGKVITVGNNSKKLITQSENSSLVKAFKGTGTIVAGCMTWGVGFFAQGRIDETPKTKYRELYYKSAYEKGLHSVVIKPYQTAVGFFALNDMPFQSYKSVNFKLQKTQKMEYFDIEYPMYYADGHHAKQVAKEKRAEEKRKLKELKEKQKQAKKDEKLKQKQLEQKIKMMKSKNKKL